MGGKWRKNKDSTSTNEERPPMALADIFTRTA